MTLACKVFDCKEALVAGTAVCQKHGWIEVLRLGGVPEPRMNPALGGWHFVDDDRHVRACPCGSTVFYLLQFWNALDCMVMQCVRCGLAGDDVSIFDTSNDGEFISELIAIESHQMDMDCTALIEAAESEGVANAPVGLLNIIEAFKTLSWHHSCCQRCHPWVDTIYAAGLRVAGKWGSVH